MHSTNTSLQKRASSSRLPNTATVQPPPTHNQTVHHNLINHSQRADPRKRRAENLISLPHAQSLRRRLNSYNFASGLDYNFLQPQTIRSRPYSAHCCCGKACTMLRQPIVATILQLQRSFNGYNLNAGFDLDHTTGQAQRHPEADSIVSTKVFDFDIANLQRSSCLSMDSTALPRNSSPPHQTRMRLY